MSRKLWLCVLVLGLGFGPVRVRADDRANDKGSSHPDGPTDVNSEESVSASMDDVLPGDTKKKVGGPAALAEDHRAGTYAGVSPGGSQPPPVPVEAGKTPPTVTWPGFQMRPNGTSRVFIESTSSVRVETSTSPGKFTVKLTGAHVAGHTNRLPLETRFFNTPVTRVQIVDQRDGVSIVLELRAAVHPEVSSERGPSGYYFTYIDLPAGKYVEEVAAPKAVAATTAAPAATPADSKDPMYLDGNLEVKKPKAKASAAVRADTSIDGELPPSIKANAKTQPKAQAGIKLGK